MTEKTNGDHVSAWYDLFSRGARDWLRHNDKVREAVQKHLPDLIAAKAEREHGAADIDHARVGDDLERLHAVACEPPVEGQVQAQATFILAEDPPGLVGRLPP